MMYSGTSDKGFSGGGGGGEGIINSLNLIEDTYLHGSLMLKLLMHF